MSRLISVFSILAISAGLIAAGSAFANPVAKPDDKGAKKESHADHADKGAAATSHAATKDAHGHDDHGHGAHHEPTQRGEPLSKVDLIGKGTAFLHPSPQLILWTLVVFGIVFFVLRSAVWKPVLHSLEHREHAIAESLRQAEIAREEAKKLLEQHDEYMTQAHDKAKQILETARAEASKDSEAILSQARADAAAAQAQAQADIDVAKKEAIAELNSSMAGVSASMANRLTNRSFDPASARKWIEEAGS